MDKKGIDMDLVIDHNGNLYTFKIKKEAIRVVVFKDNLSEPIVNQIIIIDGREEAVRVMPSSIDPTILYG